MGRKLVFLVIMVSAGVALLWNISAKQNTPDYWQGYVEDDTVLVAPEDTGRITALNVKRGDVAKKGQTLFTLEDTDAKAALAAAQARVAKAKADFENLQTGKRPEEISVQRANIDDARAAVKFAQEEYNRKNELFASQLVAARAVESAKASLDQARAKLASAEKQIGVSNLPARSKEIESATQTYMAAMADLTAAQWRVKRLAVVSPADGTVEDTIRFAGETASPQQPVVLLLPNGAHTIRFFVPEKDLASLRVGQTVAVACDGCAANLIARISYIATKAEYTPPVIYSVQSREKLVFMIEATPLGDNANWHAGQPVDIRAQP